MCGSKIYKRSIEHEDFLTIVVDLLHFLDKDEMKLLAGVAQCLWLGRNAVVHG